MIKTLIHSLAWRSERIVDRLRGQRDKRRIIEPYIGYATPGHVVVRGRVLAALRRNRPVATQSRWLNFRQMLSLFLTDEVAAVEVQAEGQRTMTDEEGYFTLALPMLAVPGWREVPVRLTGRDVSAVCPVLVPPADAKIGIISDIDDTMLQTGAYSLVRNLWTSLTGNALTRRIFPDAITFIETLRDGGRTPVYYVSSSPWNLHYFLTDIFERSGLAKGPLFLRDLGISPSQFVSGTHGDHKGSAIDTLMAANPRMRFVLVGDTGQHDAEVYRDAIARHPGRVAAVVLREPGPGPDDVSRAAINTIEATGTTVLHAPDFSGFAEQLRTELMVEDGAAD